MYKNKTKRESEIKNMSLQIFNDLIKGGGVLIDVN